MNIAKNVRYTAWTKSTVKHAMTYIRMSVATSTQIRRNSNFDAIHACASCQSIQLSARRLRGTRRRAHKAFVATLTSGASASANCVDDMDLSAPGLGSAAFVLRSKDKTPPDASLIIKTLDRSPLG